MTYIDRMTNHHLSIYGFLVDKSSPLDGGLISRAPKGDGGLNSRACFRILMVEHLKVLNSRAPTGPHHRNGEPLPVLSLTVEPLPVLHLLFEELGPSLIGGTGRGTFQPGCGMRKSVTKRAKRNRRVQIQARLNLLPPIPRQTWFLVLGTAVRRNMHSEAHSFMPLLELGERKNFSFFPYWFPEETPSFRAVSMSPPFIRGSCLHPSRSK